jgi:hypothetical protein
MRLLVFLSVFVSLLLVGVGVLLMAPYHIYETALEEGIESEFVSMPSAKKVFLNPQAWTWGNNIAQDKEKLWQSFHFSNYVIPMPIHHPLFMVVPVIERRGQDQVNFGAVFEGFNKQDYAFFKTLSVQDFDTSLKKQRIFELPIFKKIIMSKLKPELWKDLMSYSLSLPLRSNKSVFQYWSELWKISYSDLVYRLFLLQVRNQIFPENAASFSFNPELSKGLFEIHEFGVDDTKLLADDLDPKYLNEIVVFMEKGNLHRLKLKTLYNHPTSLYYRKAFIHQLDFKLSTQDSVVPIYAKYRQLDYTRRIDQEGMVYLFSSWTHVPESSDFLKEMIRFLERGRSRFEQLSPLYHYAYDNFGTTFSTRPENLRETDDQRMRRFMREKAEKEARAQKDRELSSREIIPEGKERIEYFLNKAKEEGHSVPEGILFEN